MTSIHSTNKKLETVKKEFLDGQVYIALDTETSGLSHNRDFVIELSAVKFNCNGIIGEPFSSLIKPPVPVSSFITSLTGITNIMLHDAPDEKKVLSDFIDFTDGNKTILIAHNACFDIHFINASLERTGRKPLKNIFYDTLRMAKIKFPELKETKGTGCYKLESLSETLNIKCGRNHRALSDSLMCMELFKKILSD